MLRLSAQACATALLLLPGVLPVEQLRAQNADRSAAVRVPFERYQLPNGLTVILLQDRATPTVAVEMKYHVGSKNEEPGRTGFAHLFEHVMFTGSGHVPYGLHDRLTEGVGGMNNGTTNHDATNYFQIVPSNYLEHVLWIESDRMGWLLEGLDSAKYDAQRDIVQNERRQRVDNQPYGRAREILNGAMYPGGHPYSWPVIGHIEDLQAAPLDAVKEFFRLYYAPNNATIAIVGDFDVQQTKAWVQKYFGDIPRGASIRRPDVPRVALSEERLLVYEDQVQVPRLYIQWPAVSMKHDDAAALQVLGDLLAGSRLARLTSALVYDREAAASVDAFPSLSEDAGTFVIMITPRPGQTLTALEAATDSLIHRLQREGPTAKEMQRTKAGAELRFVRALESNIGRALQLTTGELYHDDPGYMFSAALTRLDAVTSADVQRVARQYLGAGRVVLSIVPQGRREDAARAEASRPITDEDAHDPREDA